MLLAGDFEASDSRSYQWTAFRAPVARLEIKAESDSIRRSGRKKSEIKWVSNFPDVKAGWFMTNWQNGSVVWTPETEYSSRARRILAMARSRLTSQVISFEIIGSK